MEQFLVLATLTDNTEIDGMCDALERGDIPVMLEHVEIEDSGGEIASGVRVLVPSTFAQRAMCMLKENQSSVVLQ